MRVHHAAGLLLALCACRAPSMPARNESRDDRGAPSISERDDAARAREPRVGDEIVVCGRRVSIGAPVVLWTQAPGYNAYHLVRDRDSKDPTAQKLAYTPGRVRNVGEGMTEVLVPPADGDLPRDLAGLQRVVDQFVLHYDVCGTSRTCQRVLRERGLSVHFLLDVDGTLYQTLDLADTAWHATKSNGRSIGVEIAHIGAYTDPNAKALEEWYERDAAGTYITIPERFHGGGVHTQGFVGRPVRDRLISGEIQGTRFHQYDFTPEQYASLAKLTAALTKVLPRIEPRAPVGDGGEIVPRVLPDEEWERFHGVLGHYHVQANKQDPGPAFDWRFFLRLVREELGAPQL